MGINVVSPCYVLLACCKQDDKGAGQLPFMVLQDLSLGADTAPLFYFFIGRIINHQYEFYAPSLPTYNKIYERCLSNHFRSADSIFRDGAVIRSAIFIRYNFCVGY